VKGESQF